jgi:hypothetical protein
MRRVAGLSEPAAAEAAAAAAAVAVEAAEPSSECPTPLSLWAGTFMMVVGVGCRL